MKQFIKQLNNIYYNTDRTIQNEVDLEKLKASVNIVDIIGDRIDLRRCGSSLKACCPFHEEKTPSFVVNESHQFFKCFGCGASGDVIKFIEMYDNCNFKEALAKLGG